MGVQHFSELFFDDGKTNIEAQLNVIRLFPSFIQEEDHDIFLSAFTVQEVEDVLKGLKKDKSLGPDGWPVEFYLHFFDLVELDILKVIEHSRSEGRVIGALNATFITLIPKCDKPTTLAEYRPISLCNLIYNTISKSDAIRLKVVLDKAISKHQFGFLHNRQIIEPVGIVQEALHTFKVENQKVMVLKLDLVKAFDKVNWSFLRLVLLQIGIPCTELDHGLCGVYKFCRTD